MTYPLEIHLGPAKISAHLLFEMLAYTGGYQFFVWLRKRSPDPINLENRRWIFIGAVFGAWFGSHLLGILEDPETLRALSVFHFFGNKTILGGLLGGLAGVELTKKIIGVRVSSGDLMTFPLMFGMAIGRIGCHFAGLTDATHGLPSALSWAVDFGDGLPRHPVNFYEVIFLILWALAIFFIEKKWPLADGSRFKMFMVGYLLWRFFIEFLKPVWYTPLGLSVLQLAAVGGLVYYWRTVLVPGSLFSQSIDKQG